MCNECSFDRSISNQLKHSDSTVPTSENSIQNCLGIEYIH